MKKITFLLCVAMFFGLLQAQTSPDYIFGDAPIGNWTTGTQGTEVATGVYQWQFQATVDGGLYFKFGETTSNADGSGFWRADDGTTMTYTGAGNKWTANYKSNMAGDGAITFTATNGNYYIVHAKKQTGNNADFAVFESASAIAAISSVTQSFTSPNLTITVNASATPDAVQKFWVRYTKDNWANAIIVEAPVTGTVGTAVIDATGTEKIDYYVFTTVQAPTDFTDFDFYTVSLNNNGGKNYTYYAPLSGDYYMPTVPSGQKGFALLSDAVRIINNAGLAGDVNFLINGDITETTDIALGVNTNDYTLTIKPAEGNRPTIVLSNTSLSNVLQSIDGHFVIGSPTADNRNLVPTHKVVIDGSNTLGGTSRDLKIVGSNTANVKSLIRIFGNNDNLIIKNCEIINNCKSGNAAAPINVTNFVGNLAADNLLIDNNLLSSSVANGSVGIHISNSGAATIGITGLIVSNNEIFSRQRGIFCNYVNDAKIFGNTISEDSQAAQAGSAICLMTGTANAGEFNIYNNRIIRLTTSTAASALTASNGVIGIDNQLASPKIVNIYNNTISGIDANSSTTAFAKIYVIRHTGSSTSNIYHNTILLPDMKDHNGSSIAAIAFATAAVSEASPSGTINIKNNIFISKETGASMKVWGIRKVGNGGTFTSENNDFYFSAPSNYVGYYNSTDAQTLANWQTASSQDANSKSKLVYFANEAAGDLSISGTSINDHDLAVPAISTVTTDIFGTPRHSPNVYAGAHEASDINLSPPTRTFTVTVPLGTEKVYVAGTFTGKNWDVAAPLELTATGNPGEFSGIFACADDVTYKYLNGLNNWEYVEATAPATELGTNRTYNTADNVPYWKAMPKIKFNVSFDANYAGSIPQQLFVKGDWDNWATGVELTASSTPLTAPRAQRAPGATNAVSFTGSYGNGTTDVIPSDTEFKFYTNEPSADNWEDITNNHVATAPLSNIVIASFIVNLATDLENEKAAMEVKILRTPTGISVQFDGEANVELYGINGQLIDKARVSNSYNKDLNSGQYIIRVNGTSHKFVR